MTKREYIQNFAARFAEDLIAKADIKDNEALKSIPAIATTLAKEIASDLDWEETMPTNEEVSGDIIRSLVEKARGERLREIPFSVRVQNCFHANDIETMEDLLRHSRNEVLKIRNMGKRSMREIEDALERRGYSFGMLPAIYKQEGCRAWKTDGSNFRRFNSPEDAEEFTNKMNEKII